MRGRVGDPFQPLRAAHIPNAPGFAGGWLPTQRTKRWQEPKRTGHGGFYRFPRLAAPIADAVDQS